MKKRKRVLLVFYDVGLGGIQTKILDLANTLVAKGVDCCVLIEENGYYSRLHQFDKRVKIIVFNDLPFVGKRPFRRFRFVYFVLLVVLIWRPASVFVSLCTFASEFIVLLSRAWPSMVHRVVVNEDTFPSLEKSYAHAIWGKSHIPHLYPGVKKVIAVSKSVYFDLRHMYHVSSPPLVCLPNWTTFQKTKPPYEADRPIDIVYGGRLDEQKQPELMMEFFHGLLNKLPNLTIRIYGDGKLVKLVDKKILLLRRAFDICREQPVMDLSPILRRSKLFVFTSLYEGLPFVGIEAMKYGAVILGLHAPGISDLVVHGKTGILTRNIVDLASQTLALMKSPERMHDMRRAAYERARKYFSEKNRDALISMLLE